MFKLEFEIQKSEKLINLKDAIVCLGSCFSDNIGDQFKQFKFDVLANPLGTIFNPHSILKLLQYDLSPKEVIESQGVYYHWDAHGEISSLDPIELQNRVEVKKAELNNALVKANWLILTFGTAYVYELKETGQIVANCHKVPQSKFEKRLLRASEIIEQYHTCLKKLKTVNPQINIILTVSPVRHTKDGLHENNVSKGILHQAVSEILKQDSQTHYFPSYEIQIDELRDYRFYKEDMIHPNQLAIDYIWNQFRKTYIDEESNRFIEQWSKIISSLHHKAFQPDSANHQNFLIKLRKDILNFEDKIDVTSELNELNDRIKESS